MTVRITIHSLASISPVFLVNNYTFKINATQTMLEDVYSITGWYQGSPVPLSPYCLIVFEMGFYMHSVYATLYLDVVKKDHYVMLTHHILAYLLLLSSYATRVFSMGDMVKYL